MGRDEPLRHKRLTKKVHRLVYSRGAKQPSPEENWVLHDGDLALGGHYPREDQ